MASGITIEIVRLCKKSAVLHDDWMTETASWEANSNNIHPHHAFLIHEMMKLATGKVKAVVKGAYVHRTGAWKVIEDLPQETLVPVADEEAQELETGRIQELE